MLRLVYSTILLFQGNLVVVMILEYTRESNGIHLLTIVRLLLSGGLIRSLLKTHKSHLRKIQIERCVVLEVINLKLRACDL